MLDRLVDVLKLKNITIPGVIFFNIEKLGIDHTELYYLSYILNLNDSKLDMEAMVDDLGIKPKEILKIMNSLSEKNLLSLEHDKKSGLEIINLNNLYKKLSFISIDEKQEESNTLFDSFEKFFKRPLTPREVQIISAWKESGYNDDLILLALNEANFNEVYNIAYVDKILNSWDKKGYKTIEDVKNERVEYKKKKIEEAVLEDYDWLNEKD